MFYPSGRAISYTLDGAGRELTVSSSKSGQQDVPYMSDALYAPQGAPRQITLGNTVVESTTFNNRLQPITLEAKLGTASLWRLGNFYCPAGADSCGSLSANTGNNGNILRQEISIGGSIRAAQEYRYDQLNRLRHAAERPQITPFDPSIPDPTNIWRQEYKYDRFGNRRVASQTATLFTTGWDVMADELDPEAARYNAQNQVDIAGSNWHYDAAGNIDRNANGLTLGYDAENRQVAACSQGLPCTATPGAGKTVYSYDGDGRRTKKTDPSGVETVYVYDAMGNLAAEYGGLPQVAGTQYVTADHLGSVRLLTDANGLPVERHDYLPFGGDVPAAISGSFRAGLAAYTPDAPIRQRFTGKERDAETGLDYFGARYFSAAQGRFTSPDKPFADQHPEDPQSWNLYSYTRNNPLKYIDDNGEAILNAVAGAIGAGVGAIAGGAGNYVYQRIKYGEVRNWKDVRAAAVGGAISGGLAGLTLGGSLLAEAGAGTTMIVASGSNMIGGAVSREMDSDPASRAGNIQEVILDGAAGAVGGAIGEAAKRAVVSSRVLTVSGRDAVSSIGKAEGSLLQPFVKTTSGIKPTESVARTVDAVATVTGAKTTNVAYPAARAVLEKKREEEERKRREGVQ